MARRRRRNGSYLFYDHARNALKALSEGRMGGWGGALSAVFQAGLAYGSMSAREQREAADTVHRLNDAVMSYSE